MSIFKIPRINYPLGELDVKGVNDFFKNVSYLLGGNVDFINLSDKVNTVIEGKADAADLLNYVTSTALSSALSDKVTNTQLANDLQNYITNGTFTNALSNYVTNSALTTKLGQDYIITGKILANQIAGDTITGVKLKTANATNYINIQNEYVESFLNNNKVWKIGAIHYNMQGTNRDAALFQFGRFDDCYLVYDNIPNQSNYGEFDIWCGERSIIMYPPGSSTSSGEGGTKTTNLGIVLNGGGEGVQIEPQNYQNGEGGELVLLGSNNCAFMHLDNFNGHFRVHDGQNVGMEVYPDSLVSILRPLYINSNNGGGTALVIQNGGDMVITPQVSGSQTNIYNDFGELNFSTGCACPSFRNTSARELKTDITPFDSVYASNLVKSMNVYSYRYDETKFTETRGINPDPNIYHIGLIADEAPEEVSDDKSVDLYSLSSILVASQKDILMRLEKLESGG